MRFFSSSRCLVIIFLFCFYTFTAFAQNRLPAIATLFQVEGAVETVTAKSPKGRRGLNGMLLFAGDKIRTFENSKATIEYRDGSRVRLFQNSHLILNLSEEQVSSKRTFKFQL